MSEMKKIKISVYNEVTPDHYVDDDDFTITIHSKKVNNWKVELFLSLISGFESWEFINRNENADL